MAKEKNYSISGNKIFAVIAKLNSKELKEVLNYKALGYELVSVEPKKETKEEKAAAQKANPYSKINVEAFLKKKGNEDLYKEYKERYNEQAGTNRKVKGKKIADEPKFLKSGEPKVKGFANCIGWFTEKFEYNKETKEYDAK